MYCYLEEPRMLVFCNMLGCLEAVSLWCNCKLPKKTGQGHDFYCPSAKTGISPPWKECNQTPHSVTALFHTLATLLVPYQKKKKRKEDIWECWRLNTRIHNPPRWWISQRLIVNNRLITETTGRQEQDQAQYKNMRLYQWMDANRLVGGPHEMGSIHRTWAEGKNPHKVVKLALLALQMKAHD